MNHDEIIEEFTALSAMNEDIMAESAELNAEMRRFRDTNERIVEYNERVRSGVGVDPGNSSKAQHMYESQRVRADELRERWLMLDETIVEYNRRREELREAHQALMGGGDPWH